MAVTTHFIEYVLEQLHDLGDVTTKRMFGAIGLYSQQRFFALIDNDVLYFKVGDSNRVEFLARGCAPLRYSSKTGEIAMSYFTVPADVMEDAEELVNWARRSVKIANLPRPKAPAAPNQRVRAKSAKKK
jgi:DNA transformation protein and related proteins